VRPAGAGAAGRAQPPSSRFGLAEFPG
jgi:hypothetical protein